MIFLYIGLGLLAVIGLVFLVGIIALLTNSMSTLLFCAKILKFFFGKNW